MLTLLLALPALGQSSVLPIDRTDTDTASGGTCFASTNTLQARAVATFDVLDDNVVAVENLTITLEARHGWCEVNLDSAELRIDGTTVWTVSPGLSGRREFSTSWHISELYFPDDQPDLVWTTGEHEIELIVDGDGTNDNNAIRGRIEGDLRYGDDWDGDGFRADLLAGGDDCDDRDADVNPDAAEIWYDGVDQDCDGWSDYDQDLDGFDSDTEARGDGSVGTDCDDLDADINPDATEVWYDGVDQDCGGGSDYDQDLDGFDSDTEARDDGSVGDDCDDLDADINPGAAEAWYDGVDQDCDGGSDYDQDLDGFDSSTEARDDGSVGDDCDDLDPAVNPDATELVADGVDQDCDALELCFRDGDGDGWRTDAAEETSSIACDGSGWALASVPATDCDDDDSLTYPGADEVIGDGRDQSCSGTELCYQDIDEDGWRTNETTETEDLTCTGSGLASAEVPGIDCDDEDPLAYPGAEEVVGDGQDQSCSGTELCYQDLDGDGWRTNETTETEDLTCTEPELAAASVPADDCDDLAPTVNPGAPEIWYDGVDQDCDGWSDFDQDFDGFDSNAHEQLDGYFGDDCDDLDPTVNPDAVEIWYDDIDQDCDDWSDFDQDFDGYDAKFESRPDGSTGDDCDDTDATVFPGARGWSESCERVVDQDGSRALPSPDEQAVATGCDCDATATSSPAGWLGVIVLLAGLVRRRRAS